MSALKTSIFARALVLFSVLTQVVVATAPLSDSHFTETAAPQEIGSMTADGSLVYSMNYCTIVHNTDCQVSLSTGGAAPPPVQSSIPSDGSSVATDYQSEPTSEPTGTEVISSGYYGPPSTGAEPSAPGESAGVTTSAQPGESGIPDEPTASVITTTDAAGNPSTVSEGASASDTASASGDESTSEPYPSGSKTESEPTGTETEGATGTASGTPTAGAMLNAVPGFAFGIAGLVAAFLS
ncbi:hypothetical protein HJFPF1_12765 [Paramyrothecium foliicola]|nr:hypothetical protein HJFPF1_12765 [Paramyrothecium foliicola]